MSGLRLLGLCGVVFKTRLCGVFGLLVPGDICFCGSLCGPVESMLSGCCCWSAMRRSSTPEASCGTVHAASTSLLPNSLLGWQSAFLQAALITHSITRLLNVVCRIFPALFLRYARTVRPDGLEPYSLSAALDYMSSYSL
jgi:hypothetical protein